MITPIIQEEGFTVRQLRDLLSKVPDVDGEGNETMVYVATGNSMADVITIGKADSEDDILLVPSFWADVMEDLETLDDFIADD
tara:strand:- start:1 stop:249 length:249 start_codon:yes stop_codon:yes gene_type:complete